MNANTAAGGLTMPIMSLMMVLAATLWIVVH